ncbi:Pyridinium-3,5-bisthiocarboxylic acid mononucleotide nickel insertion protein [Streptomyces sp. enrichment culture]|uniref:nickel pincer cofactor biosynthesis protein LarC n=1 Tax=Streptomyces sp. enrichment culture TaxID=1795815 RepID=UPI003F5558B7
MILWLNPATGLSGDMLLGALLDLGAPVETVREAVASTGLTGWRLEAERVDVDGIRATRARVDVDDEATERRAAELLRRVRAASPPAVAEMAARAVTAVTEVEAALHGTDPAEVHLHELGGLDTVVDTVGVAAALHALEVTEVYSAPVGVGSGEVRTRHGVLPVPAPATIALLTGARVRGIDVAGETVTPTGAALLRAAGAGYGPMPAMRPARTGYGAGTKRFPGRPNVLQAVLGEAESAVPGGEEELVQLETNLDDVTGETLGHLMGRLLARGALDAWVVPAVMKKGRPAHIVHVLCRPGDAGRLRETLFAETGTLGVREGRTNRTALPRTASTVDVEGHTVRIKRGPYGAKCEYEDLRAAAEALGLPLREVAARALRHGD